ncbi:MULTISPECIES: hypothetical protein [unclassified Microbacterium]|uniref:hypothetical protein n=1 Tax=unclassified Microbacterium TaxID=2609290 RepID=UPI003019EC70
MDTQRRSAGVAENVRAAIVDSGVPISDVAEAVNVTVPDLESRLEHDDLDVADLVRVGGFLSVSPSSFLEAHA